MGGDVHGLADRPVREAGESGAGAGRKGAGWWPPLVPAAAHHRVLLVAVYYRTNLTMRQLAPLFGISPATVCRVIQRLRPPLALEPAPRPVADVDRLWIVDGTLIPVRDRTVGASSRNYRFSANVQGPHRRGQLPGRRERPPGAGPLTCGATGVAGAGGRRVGSNGGPHAVPHLGICGWSWCWAGVPWVLGAGRGHAAGPVRADAGHAEGDADRASGPGGVVAGSCWAALFSSAPYLEVMRHLSEGLR